MSIQKTVLNEPPSLASTASKRGETVSLLFGFEEDPLHTHPKRYEFFTSTHQWL